MLEIVYTDGGEPAEINYASAKDFVANQQLEVPDLEDYYVVVDAAVDGKPIELTDKTIFGLYNFLEDREHSE
ncbi:hypothetical protein OXT66_07785 [Lentilactobacillus senioris]|uniref:hypothetical protein n=1 Tax=Lentilactobacillus senioris TaxID=931534 RepID=UPI00227F1848|nr:hypothetical protein [Lentilactobacillus senioris]MCY9807432.1 hypothetical protein [Lentilactobacillus senioris]